MNFLRSFDASPPYVASYPRYTNLHARTCVWGRMEGRGRGRCIGRNDGTGWKCISQCVARKNDDKSSWQSKSSAEKHQPSFAVRIVYLPLYGAERRQPAYGQRASRLTSKLWYICSSCHIFQFFSPLFYFSLFLPFSSLFITFVSLTFHFIHLDCQINVV